MKHFLVCWAALFLLASFYPASARDWQETLHQELPLLGHRNWIVIVDSAYPWQVSPGVETVETGADQTEVIRTVLAAVAKAPHVKPTVYLDRELDFIPESAAPGVSAYRKELGPLLHLFPQVKLEHEKIISQLDTAGKTFHILVLKTNMTVPYTSVFLQLGCGYWDAQREAALRQAMAGR